MSAFFSPQPLRNGLLPFFSPLCLAFVSVSFFLQPRAKFFLYDRLVNLSPIAPGSALQYLAREEQVRLATIARVQGRSVALRIKQERAALAQVGLRALLLTPFAGLSVFEFSIWWKKKREKYGSLGSSYVVPSDFFFFCDVLRSQSGTGGQWCQDY